MNNNQNYKKEYLELKHFIGGSKEQLSSDQFEIAAANAIKELEPKLNPILKKFGIPIDTELKFTKVKNYKDYDIDKFVCISFKMSDNDHIYYYIIYFLSLLRFYVSNFFLKNTIMVLIYLENYSDVY